MRFPRPPLHALVVLSGMSGLVYQIVWIRALGLHLGTSTPAIALVTAAFMAGLALGNAWLGRRADRTERPFALYARIELGIALGGLLVSMLFLHGGTWLEALARVAEGLGAFAMPARALVIAALVLVPTTLMGGTLPVLARAFVHHETRGAAIGGLYACNTLGAVVGALVPDFWLIPLHGFDAAVGAAVLGNTVVATVVAVAFREPPSAHDPARAVTVSADASATATVGDDLQVATALSLACVSGFCGMGLELLFARTLSHWTASLVTSFSVLLAMYLVAFALGTALTRGVADRARRPEALAGLLLSLTGAVTSLEILLAPAWRDFERALWPRVLRRPGLWQEAVDALLHAGYLEIGPCLLMGMAFPFVARAAVPAGATGSNTGRLFTMNTLSGTLGALCAAFLWLPALGEQYSYAAAALLLSLCGLAALAVPRSGVIVAGAALSAGVALWLVVATSPEHLLNTHFRDGGRIVAVREGATTTAAAEQRFAFGEAHHMALLTPGVSMSDTTFGARRYMGMMAHAGMLLAHEPRDALLICYGVGNTARSLLSHPRLRQLDVVDISPEVLDLADEFAPTRGSVPLRDPRTRVFVEDGRHHLVVHQDTYDVITSEPPPPNHAGVVNLYSREFYALARQRLRPGGVITQWLPVFQLSVRDIRSMISALVAEFPHTALLYGYDRELVLVGSLRPLRLQRGSTLEPSVAKDFAYSGIAGLAEVAGAVLQNDAELRRLAHGVPPLSDVRPSLQYPWQPLSAYPSYQALFAPGAERALAWLPITASTELKEATRRAERATSRVLSALRFASEDPVEDELTFGNAVALALAVTPRDEALFALLGLDAETTRAASHALSRPGVAALLALDPAEAAAAGRGREHGVLTEAVVTLARRALYGGEPERTLGLLAGLHEAERRAALPELLRAAAARLLGHEAEAARGFRRVETLTTSPLARERLAALVDSSNANASRFASPFGVLAARR